MLNEIQGSRFRRGHTVRKLLNLLRRVVEHKHNDTKICVYNVHQSALATFFFGGGEWKSDTEEWNIADLFNLKCEKRNQQIRCLTSGLCTSYFDIKNQREHLKTSNMGQR